MASMSLVWVLSLALSQSEATAPVVPLVSQADVKQLISIRAAHESYSQVDASTWLEHWQKADTTSFDVDEVLGLLVTSRFSDASRTAALDSLHKKLGQDEDLDTDRIVRGLLSMPGDEFVRASALVIASNFGESGDFLLRRYVEILLDHSRPSKDATFICENSIPALLLLEDHSREAVANQLLFVATRKDVPLHSRRCVLDCFDNVLLMDVGASPKKRLKTATKLEMHRYAESPFTDDDEIDLLREAAYGALVKDPTVSLEVGKAALRILSAERPHSSLLREWAIELLAKVPDELAEEALRQSMRVVRERNVAADVDVDAVRAAVRMIEKKSKNKGEAAAIIREVANDPRMTKKRRGQQDE